jgi:hypothetical protein
MNTVPITEFHVSMLRKRNIWYSIKDGNWGDPATWMGNRANRRGVRFPNAATDDVYINHTVNLDNNTLPVTNPLATSYTYAVNNLYINGRLKMLVGGAGVATGSSLTVNGDLQCNGTLDFTGGPVLYTIRLMGYNNYINNFIKGTGTLSYDALLDQTILELDYHGLGAAGGGTKYLTKHTVITGPFICNSKLECGDFDFTVGGQSSSTNYVGILSKTGPGNLLFIGPYGLLNVIGGPVPSWTGNPAVEFRNGMRYGPPLPNVGSGTLSFTTNSQSLSRQSGGSGELPNIYVASGVVLDWTSSADAIVDVLDGPGTVNLIGNMRLRGVSAQLTNPMASGTLNILANSLISYQSSFPSSIPRTNYAGNVQSSGANRALTGNTTIGGNLAIDNTFECGDYNLSVGGATTGTGTFSKSGAGNLLFTGRFNLNSVITMSLTGNPNVEFRGGLSITSNLANYGTGTLNFTTNSQTIQRQYGGGIYLVPNLVNIAAGVTVTIDVTMDLTFSGIITGLDSTSKLENRGILRFTNAQEPMQTGVLDCNQAANSCFYSLNGNQNIVAGTYRNLTLNIGGVKKLLGNVSVVNTYALTTPATLNPNGYALTNP